MSKKERLEPNSVEPTLFVGVGGIGSRIIKGVADLCLHDKTDNIRFAVLDTDVNDLTRLENGSVIETIQTSSTRSIRDYLDFDDDARENWFPTNKILDSKTVSEGAGQVRAISRLAMNATIKKGTISKLYNAVDELFLKDGSDKSRAVKVVIASTVAGGTGSGIALEAAMVIRDYLKRNYPESAAIIRGFFIMPGVMDTVISTESEKQSLRRNGYATIKEINAFMMKGSGFFDSDPRLMRYKDLSLTIPSTSGPDKQLDNLPFDFCFLIDRIDSKQHSMKTLKQYENFASQSIYEQNIGPMRKSANSKEDNIVKEFIVPEKLGRCRFGGAGAAVLRYPYESIKNYIAYNWIEKNIIGVKGSKELSEEEKAAFVKNSWMAYDSEYKDELKKFENDSASKDEDKPILSKVYREKVEAGDIDFSVKLQNRYIEAKFNEVKDVKNRNISTKLKAEAIVTQFINDVAVKLASEIESGIILKNGDDDHSSSSNKDKLNIAKEDQDRENLYKRYTTIKTLEALNDEALIKSAVEKVLKLSLKTEQSINSKCEPYTIEALLKAQSVMMHPNAARYILYVLRNVLEKESIIKKSHDAYEKELTEIKTGRGDDGNVDKKQFDVGKTLFKREGSLEEMCRTLSDSSDSMTSGAVENANEILNNYFGCVSSFYKQFGRALFCQGAKGFVDEIITAYEKFYASFEDKITSINKRKENILSDIEFNNGDCVLNLFSNKADMEMLVREQGEGSGKQEDENQLFASIYDAVKYNAIINERTKNSPLLRESRKDIFDEVIVDYYNNLVEKNCEDKIDLDILHAIRYEYEINSLVQLEKAQTEEEKENIKKLSNDKKAVTQYINKKISQAQCLASPSVDKNDFEEPRDVNAIAFGTGVKDGNGIYVGDFPQLEEKNRYGSISKYELRFFSSIYNIMPTQISKFSYKSKSGDKKSGDIIGKESGDYFTAYQTYMEKIGPDSTLNPIITPHIDKRWNSISVMPEIDLDFQDDLMKYIHKAMIYGLLYKRIELTPLIASDATEMPENPNKIYKYKSEKGNKDLIVSNGTSCDQLYEVLDSLYFDRATVNELNRFSDLKRSEDTSGTNNYQKSFFMTHVNELERKAIVPTVGNKDNSPMSLFEFPVLYYNSLPAKKKDVSEIAVMVNAIYEIIQKELSSYYNKDDTKIHLPEKVAHHIELLSENYKKCESLKKAPADIMILIKETICERLSNDKYNVPTVINEITF